MRLSNGQFGGCTGPPGLNGEALATKPKERTDRTTAEEKKCILTANIYATKEDVKTI